MDMKNFQVFVLLLVLTNVLFALENEEAASEHTKAESKLDVIIKLLKRGAEKPAGISELDRKKRRSSSKKNKGRKVGKK
ncbi:unnamed protein product [Caenorhabditis sp. 36 PRJEB53466]|nr:unnamed protein product [Caenorhabditis sp. 36 PRJEB53466]